MIGRSRPEPVGPRVPPTADQLWQVIQAVADGITVQNESGAVIFANAAAARLAGFETPDEFVEAGAAAVLARFELRDVDGGPLDPARLPGRAALRGATAPALTIQFRDRLTGERRWAQVSATPLWDESAGSWLAINTFHDLTAHKQAELELREGEHRYRDLTDAIPQVAWTADAQGRLIGFNARWAELSGKPLPGRSLPASIEIHPDDRADFLEAWRGAVSTVGIFERSVRIQGRDGVHRWYLCRAVPVAGRPGEPASWIGTFTDVDRPTRDAVASAFLAEATKVLSESLDAEATIRRLAGLAVPSIADWCAVDVADADGRLEPLAIAHVDPAKVELVREFRRRRPPDPDDERGIDAVFRTGRPLLISDVGSEDLAAAVRSPAEAEILAAIQVRSVMAVPIRAGGRILGVVTLVGAESGHHYREADLAFAEELAGRAGAALQNARLYREATRFRQIVDAMWDAVNIFDPISLRISYASAGSARQLGLTREALIGRTPVELSENLTEAEMRHLIAPLVAGELPSRTVHLVRRRGDGSLIPLEVMWQYISLDGEPGQIVSIARDIEERVAAERRLEELAMSEHDRAAELNAIIRAMGEGVVVYAADGRTVLANPAAETMFPGISGWTYGDLVTHLEDPAGDAPDLGSNGSTAELRVREPGERWIELRTYPVAASSGAPRETILLLRDVTTARQREVVRDTFVGLLSHELRTPITTIYAGAKVLAKRDRDLEPETRAELFDDIQAEAERLHRLVEDVIALTRFEEGGVDVGREPVLLQRVLPAVIRSEQERWPGIVVRLELPADLPPVTGDPTYVEQVVRNLLSNAAKYGGSGSTIEIEAEEDGEGSVAVRILDDGPGFPPDEADRLFELFYRSPSASLKAGGAGIGLFVSARLIAAMDGRIWAAPRDPRGAEFGFSLTITPEAG